MKSSRALLNIAGTSAAAFFAATPNVAQDFSDLAPPSCDYGRPSADAPEELSQFQFLIGDFTVRARPWTEDAWGPYVETFRARLTGRFIMDGLAIQDDWFDTDPGLNPKTTRGLTTRMYEPATKEWKVSWMNLVNTQVTDLRVSMVDDLFVMRTVYPEGPNFDAYFEQNGADEWSRTAFKTEEDGSRTPIWQAVATRIPCPTE